MHSIRLKNKSWFVFFIVIDSVWLSDVGCWAQLAADRNWKDSVQSWAPCERIYCEFEMAYNSIVPLSCVSVCHGTAVHAKEKCCHQLLKMCSEMP